ncbi:MAG: hypothetical protein ACTHMF_11800 [Leifsonia sp.]|uniref:hypothetical protein n=1 Tax=Leifsonia sp. TaxID=1870902 RepID=UPI003F7E3549
MTRRPHRAALLVPALIAALLAGCASAPPRHSDAEISRWMDRHRGGTLGGGGGVGDTPGVHGRDGTITLDLGDPATVTGATIWCLGPGSAHVTITARTAHGSTTVPGDAECADGPHPVDLLGMTVTGVDQILVKEVDLTSVEAWYIALDGR